MEAPKGEQRERQWSPPREEHAYRLLFIALCAGLRTLSPFLFSQRKRDRLHSEATKMVPNCLFENARKGGYKKAAFREQCCPRRTRFSR